MTSSLLNSDDPMFAGPELRLAMMMQLTKCAKTLKNQAARFIAYVAP